MKDLTREVYDAVYPPKVLLSKKCDREDNCVYLRTMSVVGRAGSGKTEYMRAIAAEGRKRYGEYNVHAIYSQKGNVRALINGLRDKLVNILYIDNFTDALEKVPKEQQVQAVRDFFDLRHILKRRWNRNNGLIVVSMGLHDLYGTSPKLRSEIDVWVFRSSPTGEHRRQAVGRYIGSEGLQELDSLELSRRKSGYTQQTMGISVVQFGNTTGTTETQKPKRNPGPTRPPEKFMRHCTKKVGESAENAYAVCTSIWRKMSSKQREKWLK